MNPRVLPALSLLLGCTRSTELLPPGDDASLDRPLIVDRFIIPDSFVPQDSETLVDVDLTRRRYPFCPRTIDVYGGTNFVFPTCGGPEGVPYDSGAGLAGSESRGYDQTLAGRLSVRLEEDADLASIPGSTWTIRSCAGIGESLSQLVPPLEDDACGRNSPPTDDQYLNICTENPAPVLLIAASMLDDRCHGGGPDSDQVDDPITYKAHYQQRLNTFLASRRPRFALIGPRTEWTDPSMSSFAMPSCWWARPSWEKEALESWKPDDSLRIETELVDDLNDQFKRHHRCCREMNLKPCGPNWFDRWMAGAVNCDGAQQIVEFWHNALKRWLLSNDFECP